MPKLPEKYTMEIEFTRKEAPGVVSYEAHCGDSTLSIDVMIKGCVENHEALLQSIFEAAKQDIFDIVSEAQNA